jgi:hypothetical protein
MSRRPAGQSRVEQGGRGGAGRGGRGGVVVHPRGLPAAVVEQVQLATDQSNQSRGSWMSAQGPSTLGVRRPGQNEVSRWGCCG